MKNIKNTAENGFERISSSFYAQKTKAMKKTLASKKSPVNDPDTRRFLQKKLPELATDKDSLKILSVSGADGTVPAVGAALCESPCETEQDIIACVAKLAASQTLTSADIDLLAWGWSYALTEIIIRKGGKDCENEIKTLAKIPDFDFRVINSELNPLEKLYSSDSVYVDTDVDTAADLRRKTSLISDATGIPEQRLSLEYINLSARDNTSVGYFIKRDYRRVFPFMRLKSYRFYLCFVSAALAVAVSLLSCGLSWLALLAFVFAAIPCYSVVKPLVDRIVGKSIRGAGVLPKMSETKAAIKKTVCVTSLIIPDAQTLAKAVDKLRIIKSKNADGFLYCLLCDFPAADTENTEKDEEILRSARELDLPQNTAIYFRGRTYSKTQRKYQGWERKRGAVEQFVRRIKGEEVPFRAVIGETDCVDAINKAKYLIVLDSDTMPTLGSLQTLVAAAEHPLNSEFGIIVPRMTTSIASTLKTYFARAMCENGGCSGISSYDNVAGEFYSDCFGESIFCGKGLIRTDEFYEKCCGRFPEESILSHDILEGAMMKTAFAGDVEFADNFPPDSKAYFKRAERWLRGDFRNATMLFHEKIRPLPRLLLTDNILRGISPLMILLCLFLAPFCADGYFIGIVALTASVMPLLTALVPSVFGGLGFANSRVFYSPVLSQTKQLLLRIFMNLLLIPMSGLNSLKASMRTLWRSLVTKKNLLAWTTSSVFESGAGGSFTHLLAAEVVAALLLFIGVYRADIFTAVVGAFFCCQLPMLTFSDKMNKRPVRNVLSEAARDGLPDCTRRMWRFFEAYTNESTNSLPPDNVQFSPVYRICMRTSPTNIGMYLLSCLCAHICGFIDKKGLEKRVSDTFSTLDKLEKVNGNLYNWYDIGTLSAVSPFVSTVDSGNFVCCLVALAQGMRANGCSKKIIQRVYSTIENTDLTMFYNSRRHLFSIGYDSEKQELSPHHYDMLMSEARMTSYFAIASGQVEKAHWRHLGRTMSKCGHYAAPVAWTGTMFEYFMPEILLDSKEGSITDEALQYCLYCQKNKARESGVPFGFSESGYYAFDNGLNYQYKAHGVQKLGLQTGLDKECVVSPYSSFLSLDADGDDSYNNLVRLKKDGVYNPLYGFYEAIDYTPSRVGKNGCAIIRSHMSHHMGMSIAAATNALYGGILKKYFMADEKMKRGEELLEERIIAGEHIPDLRSEREKPHDKSFELCDEYNGVEYSNPYIPAVNILCGAELTLLCTDSGITVGEYAGKSTVVRTEEPLLRPRGSCFGFVEGEYVMPFSYNRIYLNEQCSADYERSISFSENETSYYLNFRQLQLGMNVSAHREVPAEIRDFAVKNTSTVKRQLTLCAYIEPALAYDTDIKAHPAFSDLFMNVEYDSKNALFIARRTERTGSGETYLCAGFSDETDFTYSFDREDVVERNGSIYSCFGKGGERSTNAVCVPSPCLFIKAATEVDSRSSVEKRLFITYGKSKEEVVARALLVRTDKQIPNPAEISSPLVRDTVHGRMALSLLPYLIFGETDDAEILSAKKKNDLPREMLNSLGIPSSQTYVLFECDYRAAGAKASMLMCEALSRCGIRVNAVILCSDDSQYATVCTQKSRSGSDAIILKKDETDKSMLILLKACCAAVFKLERLCLPHPQEIRSAFLPLVPSVSDSDGTGENRFCDDEYIIEKKPSVPWSNILANPTFGTLVSDSSLGFSWAVNSRENKLTPWLNDLRADNRGEMLILSRGKKLTDIVLGAKAVFAPDKADWFSCATPLSFHTSARVYCKGMAKEVELEIENSGKKAACFSVAYYTEPIIGAFLSKSDLKIRFENGAAVAENICASDIKGAMFLACSHEAQLCADKEYFFTGRWAGGKKQNCMAVCVKIELPPKSKEKIRFVLGFTKSADKVRELVTAVENAPTELTYERRIKIKTPDENLNRLFNVWLPWQILGCRIMGRTAFYQNGGAYGFRDQLQDCLAAMYFMPSVAKAHIFRCCAAQFEQGDVLHWWHNLSVDVKKGARTRCSDDMLWLPYVAAKYAGMYGGEDFLGKEICYSAGEMLGENELEKYISVRRSCKKESVYNHCKRALEYGFRTGTHGLILMGNGDWNDGYSNVGARGKGESVWLSMFYIMTAGAFAGLARLNNDSAYAGELEKRAVALKIAIDKNCWDGNHYLRAFYDDGTPMGSAVDSRCSVDLLAQAFATLSDMPDVARNVTAANSALAQLLDEKNSVLRLFTPPFERGKTLHDPGYVAAYPPGIRENGGQYTHAAVWMTYAVFELGLADAGYGLLQMLMPCGRGDRYKNEPYYLSADIYTNPQCYGRGGWSMYTGAAAWYYKCVLEKLAGAESEKGKLHFSPPKLSVNDCQKM